MLLTGSIFSRATIFKWSCSYVRWALLLLAWFSISAMGTIEGESWFSVKLYDITNATNRLYKGRLYLFNLREVWKIFSKNEEEFVPLKSRKVHYVHENNGQGLWKPNIKRNVLLTFQIHSYFFVKMEPHNCSIPPLCSWYLFSPPKGHLFLKYNVKILEKYISDIKAPHACRNMYVLP